MTNRKYLDIMIDLVEELERCSFAEPFDRQIFHDTVETMRTVNNVWKRSRRLRPWFFSLFCFLLFCLLFVIVMFVLL